MVDVKERVVHGRACFVSVRVHVPDGDDVQGMEFAHFSEDRFLDVLVPVHTAVFAVRSRRHFARAIFPSRPEVA